MLCIKPGEHGRTAKTREEFRQQLMKVQEKFPGIITGVREKGLLNAVDLNSKALLPASAYDICLQLKERGILAKPTHNNNSFSSSTLHKVLLILKMVDLTLLQGATNKGFEIGSGHLGRAEILYTSLAYTRFSSLMSSQCSTVLTRNMIGF
ncbi:hypothetical protein MKX01_037193 [Papaver californicum]|nr:hypothetical protein MKX01_037193 [Papaver californicum]